VYEGHELRVFLKLIGILHKNIVNKFRIVFEKDGFDQVLVENGHGFSGFLQKSENQSGKAHSGRKNGFFTAETHPSNIVARVQGENTERWEVFKIEFW